MTLEVRYVHSCEVPHECARCRGEILAGDAARRTVAVEAGEFFCLYDCEACSNRWGEGGKAAFFG